MSEVKEAKGKILMSFSALFLADLLDCLTSLNLGVESLPFSLFLLGSSFSISIRSSSKASRGVGLFPYKFVNKN